MKESRREDDLFDPEPELLREAFDLSAPSPALAERVWSTSSRAVRRRRSRRTHVVVAGVAYAAGLATALLLAWPGGAPDAPPVVPQTPVDAVDIEQQGSAGSHATERPAAGVERPVITLVNGREGGEPDGYYVIRRLRAVNGDVETRL